MILFDKHYHSHQIVYFKLSSFPVQGLRGPLIGIRIVEVSNVLSTSKYSLGLIDVICYNLVNIGAIIQMLICEKYLSP